MKAEPGVLSIVKREQVQTRISVKVLSEVQKQHYMAYIDRRVHRSPSDFLRYLSQVMPVQSFSYLTFSRNPEEEIVDLDTVQADDVLMVRERLNEH